MRVRKFQLEQLLIQALVKQEVLEVEKQGKAFKFYENKRQAELDVIQEQAEEEEEEEEESDSSSVE